MTGEPSRGEREPTRILFVDDEPHHAEAAADALRVVGHEVFEQPAID